jgi:hypothetical protein
LPSSVRSIFIAAGFFGRPGIVMMSPVIATTNPAPADSRSSRIVTSSEILALYGQAELGCNLSDQAQLGRLGDLKVRFHRCFFRYSAHRLISLPLSLAAHDHTRQVFHQVHIIRLPQILTVSILQHAHSRPLRVPVVQGDNHARLSGI